MRTIKTLGTNVVWTSFSFDFTPVHVFGVYLQPGETANTDETIRRVFNCVDRLVHQLPTSRILIVGDFNERR